MHLKWWVVARRLLGASPSHPERFCSFGSFPHADLRGPGGQKRLPANIGAGKEALAACPLPPSDTPSGGPRPAPVAGPAPRPPLPVIAGWPRPYTLKRSKLANLAQTTGAEHVPR